MALEYSSSRTLSRSGRAIDLPEILKVVTTIWIAGSAYALPNGVIPTQALRDFDAGRSATDASDVSNKKVTVSCK